MWLGLDYSDRAVLYRRIDLRVDKMLEDGLLDEIRALLALGVSPKATAMQAIGYKEFFGYLNGACTLDEAAAPRLRSALKSSNRPPATTPSGS